MKKEFDSGILHVATALSWRGGEQQVAYLVEELNRKHTRQMVLCSRDSAMEAWCIRRKIPFVSAVKRSSFDISYGLKIYKTCRQNNLGIIHTHDSHAHSFAIYAALAGCKAKIIVSRRVDFPVSDSFFSKYKYNHPSIGRIICVSEKIKEIMKSAVADHAKLVTIHSGIDMSRFAGKSDTGILHREYFLPPQTRIIGNVSALAPHKDFETFIKTTGLLVKEFQDVVFFIIGDGPEKHRISQLIQKHHLEKHIFLTGFRNDIADVLPEFDLFLMTSETEGLGTTLLDAFACGVPVVATAAGGIPEIVIHEQTGLLASAGDVAGLASNVMRIFNDSNLRNSLVEGAEKHLSGFTRESTAAKTLTEYHAVSGIAL